MVQQLVGSSSLGLGKLIDGKNQFIHIRYSAKPDGSNMTSEIQPDTKYIGIRTSSSETPSIKPADYSWGRFVGASGSSSYTWIRYSANEDGSNMTTIANEDTKYIGVAITDEDSAPTDHTRYSWALFKGSDGRGVERTEVSYQKSSSGTAIPAGSWSASIPSVSDGEYLWTRTLFFYTDGTTTSTFTVSRNGVAGLGIANTDVHYQKSTNGTTAPTGTWTVTIPHVMPNEYLWTRTTITYTDGSSTVSYSVGKMGADGRDAQLLYLTASSQVQAFDENDEPKTTEAIIISAKLQNASGTATFVAIPYIGNTAQPTITLGGTGNDRTLLPSQWASTKWTSIAITATLGPLSDTISVVKVKDGRTPVVHTAWADSADGTVGFTLDKPVGKIPKYKGHYVDYSLEASTDPTRYKWERNPDDAGNVADGANDKSDLANQLANAAKELADKAKADAAEANRLLGLANDKIGRLNTDVSNARSELERAEAELNSQIETVETKLTQDYATKTSLSETQITLNKKISDSVASVKQEMSETYAVKTDLTNLSGDYASFKEDTAKKFSQQVSSIETVQTDTETAKKLVNDALSKAQSAITNATNANNLANSALDKASGVADIANSASQTAADAIASANNAINSANAAKNNADKAIADVAALTKTVTAQGTKIDQTSSRIDLVANGVTEVGNKLDNLQIGGRNILRGTKEMKIGTGTWSSGTWRQSGSGAIKNVALTDFPLPDITSGIEITSTTGECGIAQNNIKLEKGKYTLSYYVKVKTPGTVIRLQTYWNGTHFSNTDITINNTNWNRISHTSELSVDVDSINCGYIYTETPNTTITVAAAFEHRSEKEGDWSPAPEDQQVQIDNINNNLTANYYQKTTVDSKLSTTVNGITAQYKQDIETKLDNLSVGSDNLIVNGGFPTDTSRWDKQGKGRFEVRKHPFYFNDKKNMFCIITNAQIQGAEGQEETIVYSEYFNVKPNTNYTLSFVGFSSQNVASTEVHYMGKINKSDSGYSNIITLFTKAQMPASYCQYYKYTFNSGNSNVGSIRFDNNGSTDGNDNWMFFGEVMLVEGTVAKKYQPSSADTQSQIDGVSTNLSNNYYTKTTIDSKLTIDGQGIATYVKSTQSQLDGLQICGENLIKNTNTDKMDITWTMQTGGYERTYYKDNGVIVTKLKRDSVQQTGWSVICVNGIVLDKLKPNTKYIVSFEIQPTAAISLQFVLRRGNGADTASNQYSMNYTIPPNQWSKITFMLTTTNPLPNLLDQVIYITGMNSAPGVEYHFRNFKMAEGNKETPWSPAPEDIAEDVQNAQDAANNAQSTAADANSRVTVAESTIKQLSDSISMLVTDKNGSSMMTQTSDGWTFNMGAITSAIDNAGNNISNLTNSLNQANHTINNLNNLANDLSKKTAYINMTTDETGAPCIELGKTGNAFKVRITNTSVDFIEGSSKIAYVSNQALFIEKAIIKNELQIGESRGFIWKTRSNGNLGLRWFG